jgi:hypothetical protein
LGAKKAHTPVAAAAAEHEPSFSPPVRPMFSGLVRGDQFNTVSPRLYMVKKRFLLKLVNVSAKVFLHCFLKAAEFNSV